MFGDSTWLEYWVGWSCLSLDSCSSKGEDGPRGWRVEGREEEEEGRENMGCWNSWILPVTGVMGCLEKKSLEDSWPELSAE